MKSLKSIIILFIIFLLCSPCFVSAGQYKATILKITDGDTVWVNQQGKRIKLRLLGIDTPEEYKSRKMNKDLRRCNVSYAEMRVLGLAATEHAKTMLYKGQDVTIKTFGKGYYGRTLAFVILQNGINYNEQEVADGYACVYKYRGHKSKEMSQREFDKLNVLLNQAREQRKGLWDNNFDVMRRLCR